MAKVEPINELYSDYHKCGTAAAAAAAAGAFCVVNAQTQVTVCWFARVPALAAAVVVFLLPSRTDVDFVQNGYII